MSDTVAPVSVVIPCFRCSQTIPRAVESVAAQTLRPREIILVDDASGDQTFEVLQRLQTLYGQDWLKIVSMPSNSGPASARNAGLGIASQPYIAFLDADDAWHPRKVEIQYKWMSQHPEVALTGHARVVVDTASASGSEQLAVDQVRFHRISRQKLLISNCFPTSTVMLRSDLGARFPEGRRYAEDYLLWLDICFGGAECYFSPLPLAFSFKSEYGEAGLSAEMWSMEKGELLAYLHLYRHKKVSRAALAALVGLSLAKYIRRVIRVAVRAKRR